MGSGPGDLVILILVSVCVCLNIATFEISNFDSVFIYGLSLTCTEKNPIGFF